MCQVAGGEEGTCEQESFTNLTKDPPDIFSHLIYPTINSPKSSSHLNFVQEETCTTYCADQSLLPINSSLQICGSASPSFFSKKDRHVFRSPLLKTGCRATFEGSEGRISSGDWSLTFWIYFALRAIHTVFLNSTFNLSVSFSMSKV